MLKLFREKIKTMTLVIIWVVVITFVGFIFFDWGMKMSWSYGQSIARIGRATLSYETLQNIVKSLPREEIKDSVQARKLALEKWIEDQILLMEAKKNKITVTENEIRENTIARIRYMNPQLGVNQQTGQFEINAFNETLKQKENKGIVAYIESETREMLRLYKSKSAVTNLVTVTENELFSYYVREKLGAKISQIYVFPGNFVDDTSVKEYYEEYKDSEFKEKTKIKIKWIVKVFPRDMTPEKKESFRQESNMILAELKNNSISFDSAAEKYSDDPTTKQKGGLVENYISEGTFTSQGEQFKDFEKALFALRKGDLSEVIESPFGFHIVKVEEKKEERIKTHREVERDIRAKLAGDEEDTKAKEYADSVYSRLKSGGEFSAVAKNYSHGLTSKDGGYMGMIYKEIPPEKKKEGDTDITALIDEDTKPDPMKEIASGSKKDGYRLAQGISDALDALRVGGYSKVIETPYGYSILRLELRESFEGNRFVIEKFDAENYNKEKHKARKELLEKKKKMVYADWLTNKKRSIKIVNKLPELERKIKSEEGKEPSPMGPPRNMLDFDGGI